MIMGWFWTKGSLLSDCFGLFVIQVEQQKCSNHSYKNQHENLL